MRTLCILATAAVLGAALPTEGYYVEGEALYWQPISLSLDFAATLSEVQAGAPQRIFSVCPRYDWGGRLRVGSEFCRNYLEGGYLWYRSHETRALSDSNPTFLLPEFFELFQATQGELRHRYQTAYVRFGRCIGRSSSNTFRAFAQVRWAEIENKIKTQGEAGTEHAFGQHRLIPRFWGIGPGAGFSARLPIGRCGLLAFTDLGLSALIGEQNIRHEEVFTVTLGGEATGTGIDWRACTTVVPEADFSIGLAYAFRCGCTCLQVHAAYELHYYWDAIGYPASGHGIFLPDASVIPVGQQRIRYNQGFGGLTFGASISF